MIERDRLGVSHGAIGIDHQDERRLASAKGAGDGRGIGLDERDRLMASRGEQAAGEAGDAAGQGQTVAGRARRCRAVRTKRAATGDDCRSAGRAERESGNRGRGFVDGDTRRRRCSAGAWGIVFEGHGDAADCAEVAVGHGHRNDDRRGILATAGRMVDRSKQGHRISAKIVDHDRDNGVVAGRAGQQMTVRAERPGDHNAGRRQASRWRAERNDQRVAIGIGNRDRARNDRQVGRILGRTGVGVGQAVAQAFFRNGNRRADDQRRIIFFNRLADFLDLGRRVEKLRRRQQIAERNARIERPDRHFEITATALRVSRQIAGRRPRLRADQQGRKVGGGHFDAAKHQLRHKDRAVDNDHRRSVGQGDNKIAADNANVRQFDTSGEDHDAVTARDNAGGVGRKFRQLADIDHQSRVIGRAGLGGQGIVKDVGNPGGRAGVALVTVIAAGIDAERAILAVDRQLSSGEAGVASASAVDRGDPAEAGADDVEPGRTGDGAGAGNDVTGCRTIVPSREMICVVARIDLARTRLGSIFVSHNPPSPLRSEAKWPAPLIVISCEWSVPAVNQTRLTLESSTRCQ